ncbi:MAG: hypothetical protein WC511_01595 [Candidatus Pacearchaeota archaeon]
MSTIDAIKYLSSKKPMYDKKRDIFKDRKKNKEDPSLVVQEDKYPDTKKPFPKDAAVGKKYVVMKGDKFYAFGKFVAEYPEAEIFTNPSEAKATAKKVGGKVVLNYGMEDEHLAKVSPKACMNYLAGKEDPDFLKEAKNPIEELSEEKFRNKMEADSAKKKTAVEAGALQDRLNQFQQVVSKLRGAIDKFRSLIFEVSGSGKVIEAVKTGNNVSLKIFEQKDSPTPSQERSFNFDRFVDYFFKSLAPQNTEAVLQDLLTDGVATITKPFLASKKKDNVVDTYCKVCKKPMKLDVTEGDDGQPPLCSSECYNKWFEDKDDDMTNDLKQFITGKKASADSWSVKFLNIGKDMSFIENLPKFLNKRYQHEKGKRVSENPDSWVSQLLPNWMQDFAKTINFDLDVRNNKYLFAHPAISRFSTTAGAGDIEKTLVFNNGFSFSAPVTSSADLEYLTK